MRNDDIVNNKPHEFLGTIVEKDQDFVPIPSSTIKVINMKTHPKTFAKAVFTSDIIVIDLLSGT